MGRLVSAVVAALAVALVLGGCGGGSSHVAQTARTPERPHGLTSSSIAGVKLRMTPDEVRAQLGQPTRVVSIRPHKLGYLDLTYVYANRLQIRFENVGIGRVVYELTTTSRAYRTLNDVGVGSTEHIVRTYLPNCATVRGVRLCGGGSTSIELRHGHAVRVNVFVPPY